MDLIGHIYRSIVLSFCRSVCLSIYLSVFLSFVLSLFHSFSILPGRHGGKALRPPAQLGLPGTACSMVFSKRNCSFCCREVFFLKSSERLGVQASGLLPLCKHSKNPGRASQTKKRLSPQPREEQDDSQIEAGFIITHQQLLRLLKPFNRQVSSSSPTPATYIYI